MKIVYTYRVVCQKLSAPELGPYTTYGILAARDLRGCQQVVQFISDVSLDRAFVEALARRCRPARPLPPAGRGRGCHQRVKPSAPKGSDQGRGAPLCWVSYSARDTAHMLFPASAVLARVCLPCAFLCGHRNLLVSSCSYSGVSKNHIRGLLNI